MRTGSTTYVLAAAGVIAIAGLLACAPAGGPGAASSGAALYRQNCAACHGPTGAGGGAGAQARDLPLAPANLRGLAAANGGVFPTETVMATIHGYRGKDNAGLMPEFGPLLDGPDVIWTAPDGQEITTPSALLALTDYLETLQDL